MSIDEIRRSHKSAPFLRLFESHECHGDVSPTCTMHILPIRMDTQKFAEWLTGMSASQKIRALAMIYSLLTINTREFFLPDATKGKEQVALHMLRGINEIHHTLANWLGNYVNDATKAFPVETLSRQLSQIA